MTLHTVGWVLIFALWPCTEILQITSKGEQEAGFQTGAHN